MNDRFRERLELALAAMKGKIESCLREAQSKGEVSRRLNIAEIADFIISGWQGALLSMKVARDARAWSLFDRIIFGDILAAKDETAVNRHQESFSSSKRRRHR